MKIIICALSYGYGVYTNPEGTGVWQKRLIEAAKKHSIQVEHVYAPRMRCLNDVQIGKVDAVYKAYSDDFKNALVFPKNKNSEIDYDAKVGDAKYHLYKLTDSNLDWDGNKFLNLEGTLIVQRGIQISEVVSNNLKRAGINKPDIVENTDLMVRMISLKRNVGGVMEDSQAQASLKKQNITNVIPTKKEFGKSEVFVIFNPVFYSKNKETVEKLWDEFRHMNK